MISKGTDSADFSGLNLNKHLELALNSVDQGFTVKTLNLSNTNLSNNFKNEFMPWFQSNNSVMNVDISGNNLKHLEKEILVLFGIDSSQGTPTLIPGTAAHLGKQILASNTGLSHNTIALLLNESEPSVKAREDRANNLVLSEKQSNA